MSVSINLGLLANADDRKILNDQKGYFLLLNWFPLFLREISVELFKEIKLIMVHKCRWFTF
jgi:hypothetical protein